MTTEVEQNYFDPCSAGGSSVCLQPQVVATAPSIDVTEPDNNGNLPLSCSPTGLMRSFFPDCMTALPGHDRHNLARFLSSGNHHDLSLTDENIHAYMQIALVLPHTALEKLCEAYLRGNKDKTCDLNSCLCRRSLEFTDNENVNNNHISNLHHENTQRVPMFQIMFLKQMHPEDHNRVLIMDIRRLDEVQKIPEVKKVSRYGDGFAACAAYIKQCPYVFLSGGNDKKHSLSKYDVVENKWFPCAHLKHARSKHSMAFVDNHIFIMGGKQCSTVEKYDIVNNHCKDFSPLPVGVHSAAHAVYGHKIFLFGGKNAHGNVNSIQCIDTRANTIAQLADLPFKCSGGQAVVVKDHIYFATHHGHMVRFDPATGTSVLCSHQPCKRKHFALFEKQGSLHLFGGVRTDELSENASTMLTYCPREDRWQKTLSFGMTFPVQTSCTVVYPKECPVKPFMKLFGYC